MREGDDPVPLGQQRGHRVELKGRELGYDLADQPDVLGRLMERVKALEARGYTFDAADASFELLLREEVDGSRPHFFDVESWRVLTDARAGEHAFHFSVLSDAYLLFLRFLRPLLRFGIH